MAEKSVYVGGCDCIHRREHRLNQCVKGSRFPLRINCLILLHIISIGLKSKEYGGKNQSRHPAAWIISRTAGLLCAAKLSITTMSLCCSPGGVTCLMHPHDEHIAVHRPTTAGDRRPTARRRSWSLCSSSGCRPQASTAAHASAHADGQLALAQIHPENCG